MGFAVRNDDERVVAAAELGVMAPVARLVVVVVVVVLREPAAVAAPSSELGSGVAGRLVAAEEKLGRRSEVRDGEGGRGVGGRL